MLYLYFVLGLKFILLLCQKCTSFLKFADLLCFSVTQFKTHLDCKYYSLTLNTCIYLSEKSRQETKFTKEYINPDRNTFASINFLGV